MVVAGGAKEEVEGIKLEQIWLPARPPARQLACLFAAGRNDLRAFARAEGSFLSE